jgi:hypothetical protein
MQSSGECRSNGAGLTGVRRAIRFRGGQGRRGWWRRPCEAMSCTEVDSRSRRAGCLAWTRASSIGEPARRRPSGHHRDGPACRSIHYPPHIWADAAAAGAFSLAVRTSATARHSAVAVRRWQLLVQPFPIKSGAIAPITRRSLPCEDPPQETQNRKNLGKAAPCGGVLTNNWG